MPVPEPAESLVASLQGRGFWLAEYEGNEDSFGDFIVVLVRRGLSIRVVRDRGQFWLEASGPGGDQWFSPAVWRAYLDHEIGDTSTLTFDDQCELLLQRLDDMQGAVESDPALVDRLLDVRAERAQARRDMGD